MGISSSHRAVLENFEGVYSVSPLFPSIKVMEDSGVQPDGRATWCKSWTGNLEHRGRPDDDWRGGGDAEGTTLSSFDVIDRLFELLADRRRYPNLRKVVLCGYSAGGQFVGRYAAVGKGTVRRGVRVEYVAMAPSTELWLNPDVTWHYGLANRPRYAASLSGRRILRNLCSRRVWRACGDKDLLKKSLDICPEASMQGANRYERFKNFEKYLEEYPKWKKQVSFHTMPGVTHDVAKAFSDPALSVFVLGK